MPYRLFRRLFSSVHVTSLLQLLCRQLADDAAITFSAGMPLISFRHCRHAVLFADAFATPPLFSSFSPLITTFSLPLLLIADFSLRHFLAFRHWLFSFISSSLFAISPLSFRLFQRFAAPPFSPPLIFAFSLKYASFACHFRRCSALPPHASRHFSFRHMLSPFSLSAIADSPLPATGFQPPPAAISAKPLRRGAG